MPIYLGKDKISSGGGGVSIEEITPEAIGALPETTTPADIGALPTSEKGTANGVASLNTHGKVRANQLTSKIISKQESFTIDNSLNGCTIYLNSTSNTIVTLPNPVDIDVEFECEVIQFGTGSVTFQLDATASEDGRYMRSLDNCSTIAGRFGAVSVKRLSSYTWLLAGALA